MEDLSELMDYFKKIQRALDNADFNLFSYKFVKKSRIDDLLVCTLALLPASFKSAMKRRLNVDNFPAVACYNRLSKLLKRNFWLFPDYYMVHYISAKTMINGIKQDISSDLKRLEGM